jgi:hypothetical protein
MLLQRKVLRASWHAPPWPALRKAPSRCISSWAPHCCSHPAPINHSLSISAFIWPAKLLTKTPLQTFTYPWQKSHQWIQASKAHRRYLISSPCDEASVPCLMCLICPKWKLPSWSRSKLRSSFFPHAKRAWGKPLSCKRTSRELW